MQALPSIVSRCEPAIARLVSRFSSHPDHAGILLLLCKPFVSAAQDAILMAGPAADDDSGLPSGEISPKLSDRQ